MTRRQFSIGRKPYYDSVITPVGNPITVAPGATYNYPYIDGSGYQWFSFIGSFTTNSATPNYTIYLFAVGANMVLGIGSSVQVTKTAAGTSYASPGVCNNPTQAMLIRVTNTDTTTALTIGELEAIAG